MAAGIVALLAAIVWFLGTVSAARAIENAELAMKTGRIAEALELLHGRTDSEALYLLGQAQLANGDFPAALKAFESIQANASVAINAQLHCAVIHFQQLRLGAAASCFTRVIEFDPENLSTRMGRIQIAAMTRRLWSATEDFDVVERLGALDHKLLTYRTDTTWYEPIDSRLLQSMPQESLEDPMTRYALGMQAFTKQRWNKASMHFAKSPLAVANGIYEISQQQAGEPVPAGSLHRASRQPTSPEWWSYQARRHIESQHSVAAIRCCLEALEITPDYHDAVQALAKAASIGGFDEIASEAADRAKFLDKVHARLRVLRQSPTAARNYKPLVEALVALRRTRDAQAWYQLSHRTVPTLSWNAEETQLVMRRGDRIPHYATILRKDFPLPADTAISESAGEIPAEQIGAKAELLPISFFDDAEVAGLTFQTFHRQLRGGQHRLPFEFTGTGVAVLDFDADGFPDVFFPQAGDPNPTDATVIGVAPHPDKLFRNRLGKRFVDTTSQSFVIDSDYGQGVAAGDVDGDGFDDLYVAQIGRNRLLINNGDGTFRESREAYSDLHKSADSSNAIWTSSVAIADVNNDGAADLFDVNYLRGEGIFDRICRGSDGAVSACSPLEFLPSHDVLLLGDGSLSFTPGLLLADPGNGLGIVVGEINRKSSGPEVYVANDLSANHCYGLHSRNRKQVGDTINALVDQALFMGLAFNSNGDSEAGMGIALGDFDSDAAAELFVTNFHGETNTLYRGLSPGVFDDSTSTHPAINRSRLMLGFGTQPIDVDLDGDLDLVVVNGHVDEHPRDGSRYQMPMDVLRNADGKFLHGPRSQFASLPAVGRALATIDWNDDLRTDLIATYLDRPVRVLTNQTEIDPGLEPIRITLTGRSCQRGAVGATIRLLDTNVTRFVNAGDGYMASNQRITLFRVPKGTPRTFEIRWPNGNFERISIGPESRFRVIEGSGVAVPLP